LARYDIYNVEERLREYDPELFRRVDWDEKRSLHRIICYDPHDREEYCAFTVQHGQLDHRVVSDFMRISPKNGYNPFEELDQKIDEKERAQERKITDMATDLAENILGSFSRKPSRAVD
jgi:hypothetical protein